MLVVVSLVLLDALLAMCFVERLGGVGEGHAALVRDHAQPHRDRDGARRFAPTLFGTSSLFVGTGKLYM